MQQYVLHEDGVGEAHFARRIDNSCVNAPTWIGQEPVSSLVPKAIMYVVAESSNHRVMKWSQWVKGDVVAGGTSMSEKLNAVDKAMLMESGSNV